MGKNKSQQNDQLRQFREEERRREEEKARRQNRLIWEIVGAVVAVIVIVTAVTVALSLGGNDNGDGGEGTGETRIAPSMNELDFDPVALSSFTESDDVTEYVQMNVTYTDKSGILRTGDIVVRLFPEVAPKTVANFQNLVADKFYDGLTFHRVHSGFMIQGGDPKGNGTGNATYTIKGEFNANGFENNLKHVRGVISMARGSYSMDSASCQFFITHADYPSLNGQYASFGYVVYGMDTVDGIAETEVGTGSNYETPVHPVTINYIRFVKQA